VNLSDPDPALGKVISEHRHTLTYPLIVSSVALGLLLLCVLAAVNGAVAVGLGLGVPIAAGTAAFVWSQSRHRLYVHENGIRLVKRRSANSVTWDRVERINTTFSYHSHPDTIIDVSIRQRQGPRLVLRMNWSNRKELARHLWPIIQSRQT
jgi:hypothetical protein